MRFDIPAFNSNVGNYCIYSNIKSGLDAHHIDVIYYGCSIPWSGSTVFGCVCVSICGLINSKTAWRNSMKLAMSILGCSISDEFYSG